MPKAIPIDTLLPWNTTSSLSHANWHNVRVLCDLEGLSYEMKEDLTATVWGESEFNTHAKCPNYKTMRDGSKVLESTDNGIAQWNDWWHWIRKAEISPADAINDPEKAIRLMCRYFLAGQADDWVAHKTGRYLKFMGRSL